MSTVEINPVEFRLKLTQVWIGTTCRPCRMYTHCVECDETMQYIVCGMRIYMCTWNGCTDRPPPRTGHWYAKTENAKTSTCGNWNDMKCQRNRIGLARREPALLLDRKKGLKVCVLPNRQCNIVPQTTFRQYVVDRPIVPIRSSRTANA